MIQGISVLLVVCANFFAVHCYGSYLPGAMGLSKSSERNSLIDSVIAQEERAFYAKVLQRLMYRAAAAEEENNMGDNFDSISELNNSDDLNGAKRSMNKRKVFWQPLGYVPASMRMSSGSKHHSSTKDAGRKGFRYGK